LLSRRTIPGNLADGENRVSDIDPRLIRVCDGYRLAVYEKDVEAFLGLYHAEARVFDTWGVWSYEGVGGRRKVVEEWFSSLGDERVGVAFDRMQAAVGSDLATLSARVVYAGLSAAGEELRSMQNRLTWVLVPQGGSWNILHEHTSVPIGFNDLKGMLKREP
jgi:ketosteroid isomerase-like protein